MNIVYRYTKTYTIKNKYMLIIIIINFYQYKQ